MKIVGIVGPSDAGKTTLIERLAERLAERGRVGTVKRIDCEPTLDTEGKDTARHRAAGAARTYGVTGSGRWFGTGEDRTLSDALDALAPECDYALVEGGRELSLPKVVLGGEPPAETVEEGDVLARAETAADADVDALLGAIEDVDPYETLGSLVARAKASSDAEFAGAIATFTGRVRTRDGEGDVATEALEFERYDGVAEERTAAIREELERRDGVHEVLLHHRTGVVEAGEDIVFVVVLAGHRAEAFETVEDGIDRLKDEVPLFKKEITVEDESWAHER